MMSSSIHDPYHSDPPSLELSSVSSRRSSVSSSINDGSFEDHLVPLSLVNSSLDISKVKLSSTQRSPIPRRNVDDRIRAIKLQKARRPSLKPSFPRGDLDWDFLDQGLLYGRDEEMEQLRQVFGRRVGTTEDNHEQLRPELVLVSGKSGTGKSVLVKRSLQTLVDDELQGHFLLGKFDQLQSQGPYGPFVAALSQLASSLESDPQHLQALRHLLLKNLGLENCQVICSLVPAFGRILFCFEAPALGPPVLHDAQRDRLQNALCRFFRIFCSAERPVVLVLDDLQWSDAISLELLEALVSDTSIRGFMAIGVCRSNEVDWGHSFSSMLRRLEDEKGGVVDHVHLSGLTIESINALLADMLRQPVDICKPLATLVHNKSEGNVCFVLHYLTALREDGVLVPGRGAGLNDYLWMWNHDAYISFADQKLSIIDMISREIQRLDDACQRVLKVAACIGAEFERETILKVFGKEEAALGSRGLETAMKNFLIEEHTHRPGHLNFAHDQIQKAVYTTLIKQDDHAATHLSIGQALLHRLSPCEMDANLFLIVNQLCCGEALLTSQVDQTGLADLCTKAGMKASAASDFQTAIMYFDKAEKLLPRRHWRDEYRRSYVLFNVRAEAEYCLEAFSELDATVDEILRNCRCVKDKNRALLTKIYSLGARAQYNDAIDLGLKVLANLGEKFPSKPSILYLVPEFLKVKRRLKKMTDNDILNLPTCSTSDHEDQNKVMAMSILNLLQFYAFCSNPDLFPFLVLRFIKLTLKHGRSDMACLAFASYGMLLCVVDESDEGYRYGCLGLQLFDQCVYNRAQILPRLHFIVYGMLSPWKVPLRSTLEPLKQVATKAVATGDFECSLFSSYTFVVTSLASGTPLPVVEDQLNDALVVLSRRQHGPWLALTRLVQNVVHNFMGKTDDPLALTLALDPENATKHDFLLYESVALTFRLELAYHFYDIDLALKSTH